jgi:hypothetical protein
MEQDRFNPRTPSCRVIVGLLVGWADAWASSYPGCLRVAQDGAMEFCR